MSVWSTVALQHQDDRLWTHDTKIVQGNVDHNNRSYTIQLTKRTHNNNKYMTHNKNANNSTIPTRAKAKMKEKD